MQQNWEWNMLVQLWWILKPIDLHEFEDSSRVIAIRSDMDNIYLLGEQTRCNIFHKSYQLALDSQELKFVIIIC